MPTNTYVALDKKTATTSIANAEFTSIPQGYTDLVVVVSGQVSSNVSLALQVNGDTGNSYSVTELFADGTTPSSFAQSNNAQITVASIGAQINSGSQWVSTLHFQNYSNTTTNKTILGRTSAAGTGVNAIVGMYRSTTAITSIKIMGYANASGFTTGTTFSLYGIAATSVGAKATGGDIYTDSLYYYHVFDSTGTFTPLQSLSADILCVAGGGGAGLYAAGGGGAGGVITFTNQSLTATGYTCTVGSGGAKSPADGSQSSDGTNSSFGALTAAIGGGGGGGRSASPSFAGRNGGSGGGGGGSGGTAGGSSTQTGTGATNFYGNAGGQAVPYAGAGGGGAGAAAGTSAVNTNNTGNGGVGIYNSLINAMGAATGTGELSGGNYYFAGGGCGFNGGSAVNTKALGGGGGADRGTGNGTANTGGGGGSTNSAGDTGNGGSGIVIVRYAK